jgi:C4-dicarboxylate transporter DctQ subunit
MFERIKKWYINGAEFISAMLLAGIFITFLFQIFTRYLPNLAPYVPIESVSTWLAGVEPLGWTVNFISLLWVLLIFFGCSFLVKDRDHVSFDILYLSLPRGGRRVFALLAAVFVVVAMIYAFPATWDYVMNNRFLTMKKIPTLEMPISGDKIPMQYLFIPFIVFMVVSILRYLYGIVNIIRFGPPEDPIELIAKDIEPSNTSEKGDVA